MEFVKKTLKESCPLSLHMSCSTPDLEEWLPKAGTLESAKSYRKRIVSLLKKVASMIQSLYSKYSELKDRNRKLLD